ncbi:hypothetical protein [Massilia rubra]|uniref:ESPR domain-containing protein n=1 Tax=Massilia rubra TaxID=2607910 RepID=A0ABX0LRY8_9BURK|nr:hypothetical protein [Massilia rubra]NHZ35635.1 hypothetical protein [Massilia rubra]
MMLKTDRRYAHPVDSAAMNRATNAGNSALVVDSGMSFSAASKLRGKMPRRWDWHITKGKMMYSSGWVRKASIALACGISCAFASGADARTAANVAGKCIMESEHAAAVTLSKQADKLIDDGNYVTAITLLDRGIGIVGNAYHSQDVIDDTGMKLTLSHIEERKGSLSSAANLRSRVLSSRLELYGQRLECTKKK